MFVQIKATLDVGNNKLYLLLFSLDENQYQLCSFSIPDGVQLIFSPSTREWFLQRIVSLMLAPSPKKATYST
jgi:hypothetical protein